jgi:hypothetical protein
LRKVLLKVAAALIAATSSAYAFPLILNGTARPTFKWMLKRAESPKECQQLCFETEHCYSWSFQKGVCQINYGPSIPVIRKGAASGLKPAYLIKRLDTKIRENWGKSFKVILCSPYKIPNSDQYPGWKEKAEALGDAVPPEGAVGVLYLYPPTFADPAVVEGTVKVPKEGGTLVIRTAGNVNSSYELEVAVNDKIVKREIINGNKWHEVKVPLRGYEGKKVVVDVLGFGKTFFYPYIFIDWIKVVPTSQNR